MPYERIPGVVGLIYVSPKEDNVSKKHPCPDCFVCQWCGDSRCASCRGSCNRGTAITKCKLLITKEKIKGK
jgi:hypothetical protein